MPPIFLTRQQVCRYLIRYQHLTDDTALDGDSAIVEFVRRVGCLQFDPLDVVGKNPDLVLQSRCSRYRKGNIEELLYKKRLLFDVWDKNMSICAVEDWPYFSRHRQSMRSSCRKFTGAIKTISGYLKEHGYACSSDFDLEDRVDWHYGPQRLAKAALECMCYAGLAVVHHKKGTRRYYCLAEDCIPPHLFTANIPNTSDDDYGNWLVLRRINSIGLLWNRGSDAWLGAIAFKSAHRNAAFSSLAHEGKIVEVRVEGLSHPLYIARKNLPVSSDVFDEPIPEENIRILAPLDNFLWDRKLILELFGFDYKWEVYVPAAKRKYGYYVLPVLCGERFVGRIEMRTDRASRTLTVLSFRWEDGAATKRRGTCVRRAIRRFADYNLCEQIAFECGL